MPLLTHRMLQQDMINNINTQEYFTLCICVESHMVIHSFSLFPLQTLNTYNIVRVEFYTVNSWLYKSNLLVLQII